MPETEMERIALESNIKELVTLKSDKTPESAERAIKLARDCMGILFKGEAQPADEKGLIVRSAAEARFAAGRDISIWGTEKKWDVWINKSKEDDGILRAKRDLIQKVCDEGSKLQVDEMAGNLALREAIKVDTELRLLDLAGARSLATNIKKDKVFRVRVRELNKAREQAEFWTIVKNTTFRDLPEMKNANELIDQSLRKVIR